MIQFGRKPSLLRFLAAFGLTVMVAPIFAADTDDNIATVPLRLRELDARDPSTFTPDGTERTRLWIVQFAYTPTHDDRTLIAQSGAEVVDYLPFNAYMIFDQTSQAVAKLRDAMASPDSSVRLLAPFRDTDAIDPQLRAQLSIM